MPGGLDGVAAGTVEFCPRRAISTAAVPVSRVPIPVDSAPSALITSDVPLASGSGGAPDAELGSVVGSEEGSVVGWVVGRSDGVAEEEQPLLGPHFAPPAGAEAWLRINAISPAQNRATPRATSAR
ncbi:hypothetical protein GCM10022403_079850 [Streptomyces coacervatus]|uniref:Uncharacterized protein n=1 Tax=Streptomyces coacervatus TaxID=647381 RepID=A0ABP7J551_9ACTN